MKKKCWRASYQHKMLNICDFISVPEAPDCPHFPISHQFHHSPICCSSLSLLPAAKITVGVTCEAYNLKLVFLKKFNFKFGLGPNCVSLLAAFSWHSPLLNDKQWGFKYNVWVRWMQICKTASILYPFKSCP